MPTQQCRTCNTELTHENWYPSWRKRNNCLCSRCVLETQQRWRSENQKKAKAQYTIWRKANPEKVRSNRERANRKKGMRSYKEDRTCSMFLGVHVAERVLKHVFKDVETMPVHTPRYDFVCNRGKKIDVKSACISKSGQWTFRIAHNTTADYFLCVAFDNRGDLNPLHLWLIPGVAINSLQCTGIRPSTVKRWAEYRLDTSKMYECCNILRGD